jgi:cytoskeletal protein CcmA (bactofilin family)
MGKGKSVGENRSATQMQPLQSSINAHPAATMHPSEAISSISAETTVVGKIVCKGSIKIYGLVEGELSASKAIVAHGAQIKSDIVADELIISGRVKGNLYARRVKLRDMAVIEGDIYHRSLSIDENVRFEGSSRPNGELPEAPSTIEVSSDPPPERQTLFEFGEKEHSGELSRGDLYQPRGRRTQVFLVSCIAAIAISVVGYFALRPNDPSWIWRSVESHYTALRAVMGEAPHKTPVAQMAPATVAPEAPATPSPGPEQVQDSRINGVRSARQTVMVVPEAPATPSLDAEQVQDSRIDDVRSSRQTVVVAPDAPATPSLDADQVQDSRIDDVRSRQAVIAAPEAPATPSLDAEQDFRIDDVRSARQSDVTRLTSNAIKFSDHTTAGGIDSETALMPFAVWASNHPTEKKFLALFPSYVEPVIESDAADGADKATEKPYTEKLYMYVAQARFVLAKAPAEIDLSRYVTLRFLEKIDPAIKHNLISAADAAAFKNKAGPGNDNPDRKWCTGPATSICIQSNYKFEGKIPIGIKLVNQLRESKKVADHLDFQSELAVLTPSDVDQVGLQELTGLDTPIIGALEQNIFYVNQIMKFGKFFAVLQTHPSDAGKTAVTAFVALAIKASVLDQKRGFENMPVLRNLVPAQVLMGRSSFNFGSSISAGLPKYARNEIKTVATLLQQ